MSKYIEIVFSEPLLLFSHLIVGLAIAYIIITRVVFYIRFHKQQGQVYYFQDDKLYTYNRLSPLPLSNIIFVRIHYVSGKGGRGYQVICKKKKGFLARVFVIPMRHKNRDRLCDDLINRMEKNRIECSVAIKYK